MTAAFSGPFSGTRRRRNKAGKSPLRMRPYKELGNGQPPANKCCGLLPYKFLKILSIFWVRGPSKKPKPPRRDRPASGGGGSKRSQGRHNEIGRHQGAQADQQRSGDIGEGAAMQPGRGRADKQELD